MSRSHRRKTIPDRLRSAEYRYRKNKRKEARRKEKCRLYPEYALKEKMKHKRSYLRRRIRKLCKKNNILYNNNELMDCKDMLFLEQTIKELKNGLLSAKFHVEKNNPILTALKYVCRLNKY